MASSIYYNKQIHWRQRKQLQRCDADSMLYCPSSLIPSQNHFGGIGGGHYTAYAYNLEAGKWLEFNDRRVSEIDASKVRGSQSYLLFYRKRKQAEVPASPADE